MGLDQYLYKKTFVGGWMLDNKEEFISIGKSRVKIGEIDNIESKVMYWRNNYAINDFFMDKVNDGGEDNCRYFYVQKKDLEELRDILKEIVNQPTQEGSLKIAKEKLNTEDLEEYFTDWYLPDFKKTLEKLEKLIKQPDSNDCDFYYYIWY